MSDKLNLLILFPIYFYQQKMSMVRRHVVDHLIESELCNTVISGQGWADWDDKKTVYDNQQKVMPNADAIFWYKPEGSREIPPLREPKRRDFIPAVASYNEAWWPDWKALRECQDTATTLVVCHHQNDVGQFLDGPGDKPSVAHIPHCADPNLFATAAKPWSERTTDVLVSGVQSEEIYPVRARLARIVKGIPNISVKILKHPGYRLASLAACRKQEKNYAAELGNAKIAVVCSSRYGYGLAKYVEASMAGCLLLGDKPIDFDGTLNEYILPGGADVREKTVVELIEAAIGHDGSELVSKMASQSACKHLSTRQYCIHFLDLLKAHLTEIENHRQ